MARFLVIATAKGYLGGAIRNPGDRFECPSDEAFSAEWMERFEPAPTIAVAADAGQDGQTSAGIDPAGPVPIPADWRGLHYTKRIALAKAISGLDDVTAERAVSIIEAEADNRDAIARGLAKPAPISDEAAIAEASRIAAEAEAADKGAGGQGEEI